MLNRDFGNARCVTLKLSLGLGLCDICDNHYHWHEISSTSRQSMTTARRDQDPSVYVVSSVAMK